jgi:hypothetical protein
MNYIEVLPAYGRDYKNQKDVQSDWDAGKDFLAMSFVGPQGYINKQDANNAGLKVIIRYANQMKVYSPK